MKVQFIGLGYIGLPTAAVVASNGISVHGVDINPSIVETINKGNAHFFEPGLESLLSDAVQNGYFKASITPQEADVHLMVVPTPFKENNEPDISYVEAATRAVLPFLKEGDIYILESTSPVGTTEKMANLIFEFRPELIDKIYIAYCPERVLPGNVLYELINNDRIIGGINDVSAEKATNFYKKFVKGELHKTNSRTAELCKLTENSSRDVQIAFANELSMICNKAGIDVWELIHLANRHPRVNILKPGVGVGGHCIAVDPYFIVSDFRDEALIIAKAREVNKHKTSWCSEVIRDAIIKFKSEYKREPIVAMMGLAFKPNIDDLRESPALQVIQEILQINEENIFIVEPNIKEHKIFKLTNYIDAFQQADIIAFLVAHDQFKEFEFRDGKIILDFCGVLESKK